MDVDRETVYQLVLAGGAVALFIAAAVYVSSEYGHHTAEGTVNLTQEGGMVLVATLGLFILLMLGAGLLLERTDF